MESLLSKEERNKTAKLCKNNPYKAMELAEFIFRELQMKTIPEFAKLVNISERTIYNHINDPKSSKYEFSVFCNDKYIPAALNKDLIES